VFVLNSRTKIHDNNINVFAHIADGMALDDNVSICVHYLVERYVNLTILRNFLTRVFPYICDRKVLTFLFVKSTESEI